MYSGQRNLLKGITVTHPRRALQTTATLPHKLDTSLVRFVGNYYNKTTTKFVYSVSSEFRLHKQCSFFPFCSAEKGLVLDGEESVHPIGWVSNVVQTE